MLFITENKLKRIIEESIRKFLSEGIDFDNETLTVSYNPLHEDNVETSIVTNPTVDKDIVNGIEVWSIFKRKIGLRGDGNPLIYALKNEGGWHFKTEEDKKAVFNQINKIVEKFVSLHNAPITVVIPSGNELNNIIADIVKTKNNTTTILKGVIVKMTTEEVDDIVLNKDSEFRKYYGKNFNAAYHQLTKYFDTMDEKRNGTFSRHFVKDKEMRNVLNKTLKLSTDKYAEFANKINGNDIILIDDTISRGQTIIEACRIINESYAPKSITVLTLLSKLA